MADNNNTLEIEITAKSNKMDTALKSIERQLSKLKNLGGSLDPFEKNFKQLQVEALKLKDSLKGFDFTVDISQNELLKKNIDEILKKVQELNREARKEVRELGAQKALEDFKLSLDPIKQKTVELNSQLKEAENRFLKFASAARKTDKTREGLQQAKEDIKRLTKELDNNSKAVAKSTSRWKVFLGRVKNISIYRAIRTGIKSITSGVTEGLQSLAVSSDEVNQSMSNITNSFQQVKNTMAISAAGILQSLEPLLTQFADTIIDVLNSFNRALAKVQGKDYWLQAKKSTDKYAESVKKARKLSFDTFEVLSGGDDKTPTEDLFQKVYFSEGAKTAAGDTDAIVENANEANSALDGVFETLISIGDKILDIINKLGGVKTILITVGTIFATKFTLSAISSIPQAIEGITGAFTKLKKVEDDIAAVFDLGFGKMAKASLSDYFKTAEGGISKMKIATTALTSAVAGLAAFTIADTIFGVFHKEGKIIAGVIGIVAAAFAGLAIAALAAAGAMSWGVAIPAIVAAVAVGAAGIKAIVNGAQEIQGLANGGFTNANLIATNENGKREWIGRNAGATAVVNDTQMSDIMYQAVKQGCYEGIAQAMYEIGSYGEGDVRDIVLKVDNYILGKVVAGSKGFKNEAVRIGLI